ncbi:hypothetical protein GRD97_15485 [Bacteroides ovatus]|nr:hypothetical protein [Bacteroides ovatus]
MNRKLLLLLALLLFSYGLLSCSSDDNSPSEGEQTDTPIIRKSKCSRVSK